MAAYIAVVDRLPMFQEGVAGVLTAAGHVVKTPADSAGWVPTEECSVVLLTLSVEHDWVHLGRLADLHPGPAIIAFVEDDSVELGVRAIRTGAVSVLPRRVLANGLVHAVAVTIDGQAVMPAAVAEALAAGMPSLTRPVTLSAQQRSWLRQLAAGTTVARLAADVGYSERAMYRLLSLLYRRMGVPNRVQAILFAQQQGWLTSDRG